MGLDHAAAGAGRHHDVVEAVEFIQKFFGQVARRLAVAGIVAGLAAAGLLGRHHDFAAGRFQQFQSRKADFRPHHIDQAGDKQSDAHRVLVWWGYRIGRGYSGERLFSRGNAAIMPVHGAF